MILTEQYKHDMRDALEMALNAGEDEQVLIAIHINDKGKAWQNNYKVGELASACIHVYNVLCAE